MNDDAVILHENDGGNLTSLFLDAAKLVADGKGQICAGIGVGDPAPGVVRAVERLFRDLAAGGRAGGEICVDAVGVADKGLENGVEAGLDGGAQCVHALDKLRVFLCAGGAELFNVGQLRRLVAVVEAAERFIVEHGVGLVRTDIRQTVAGGLDGHEAVGQLDGGVAAAALHIVAAAAGSLRHGGKLLELFLVFRHKISHDHILFSLRGRLRTYRSRSREFLSLAQNVCFVLLDLCKPVGADACVLLHAVVVPDRAEGERLALFHQGQTAG